MVIIKEIQLYGSLNWYLNGGLICSWHVNLQFINLLANSNLILQAELLST